MTTVQEHYRFSLYTHNDNYVINKIHFYNETGIIHTSEFPLKDEKGEIVKAFKVASITDFNKTFRKEETYKKFLNKMFASKTNFTLPTKKDIFGIPYVDLFIYIDNESVILLKQETSTEESLHAYNFDKFVNHYTTSTLSINNVTIVDKHLDRIEVVNYKELQEQARKVYQDIKDTYNLYGINESDFFKLFNQYELIKRKEPLMK